VTVHNPVPHEEAVELLPWLVNESLDGETKVAMSAHVASCVMCRREIAELKALSESIRQPTLDMPIPEPDMRRINARIDAQLAREGRAACLFAAVRDFLRNPWRIAFVAQTLALLLVVGLWLQQQSVDPEFRTLTSDTVLPDGHYLRVVFDPTLEPAQLSALIDSHQLQIVSGPSERGVFTLQFATAAGADERTRITGKLLENPAVLFAQQIGSGE